MLLPEHVAVQFLIRLQNDVFDRRRVSFIASRDVVLLNSMPQKNSLLIETTLSCSCSSSQCSGDTRTAVVAAVSSLSVSTLLIFLESSTRCTDNSLLCVLYKLMTLKLTVASLLISSHHTVDDVLHCSTCYAMQFCVTDTQHRHRQPFRGR
jgi:hypothetical protein